MGMQNIEDLSNLPVVCVDIGKNVFHPVGFDAEGNRVLRRKITRLAMGCTFEALLRCIFGMADGSEPHFDEGCVWDERRERAVDRTLQSGRFARRTRIFGKLLSRSTCP